MKKRKEVSKRRQRVSDRLKEELNAGVSLSLIMQMTGHSSCEVIASTYTDCSLCHTQLKKETKDDS